MKSLCLLAALLGITFATKYLTPSIANDFPLLRAPLKTEEGNWVHNLHVIESLRLLSTPDHEEEKKLSKELKGYKGGKLAQTLAAVELGKILNVNLAISEEITKECMHAAAELSPLATILRCTTLMKPNTTFFDQIRKGYPQIIEKAKKEVKTSIAGISIGVAVENTVKTPLIDAFISKFVSVLPGEAQLYLDDGSSILYSSKALLALLSLTPKERAEHASLIDKLGHYLLANSYTVQTVEELYFYLLAADKLQGLPLAVEIPTKKIQANSFVSLEFILKNIFGKTLEKLEVTKVAIVGRPEVTFEVPTYVPAEKKYVAKLSSSNAKLLKGEHEIAIDSQGIERRLKVKVRFVRDIKFDSLAYRLGESDPSAKTNNNIVLEAGKKMQASLKATHLNSFSATLQFNIREAIPTYAYALMTHTKYPKVITFVKFSAQDMNSLTVNFSIPDLMHNLNGEYRVLIHAESPEFSSDVLEWDIGTIDVQLLGGLAEYTPPSYVGVLKQPTIVHIFAGEQQSQKETYFLQRVDPNCPFTLPYAIPEVAGAFTIAAIAFFVLFFINSISLDVSLNNMPKSFSGLIYSFLFFGGLTALLLFYVYFWVYMRFLDFLPYVFASAVALVFLGRNALKSLKDPSIKGIEVEEKPAEQHHDAPSAPAGKESGSKEKSKKKKKD